MRKRNVAIMGFGRVGKVCGELIRSSQDLILSGIIRRPESLGSPLPNYIRGVPVVTHCRELTLVDMVLLCVPPSVVKGMVHDILQLGIPLIDSVMFHGEEFKEHKSETHRIAIQHKVSAIIGAGWDPGAISLFRSLFSLLIPKGHSQAIHRTGKDLHHTLTVESVPGVKEALATERRTADGKQQRYVYVEVDDGADRDRIVEAIQADPLFLDHETFVFPVDSVEALEDEGHGIVLDRRGTSGRTAHQHLLLEARFDAIALTAEMMIAACRVLPNLEAGAYSLLELPIGQLLPSALDHVEKTFI
jgi:diaminopimelate dehydrogenase